jgi:hypothetical protein
MTTLDDVQKLKLSEVHWRGVRLAVVLCLVLALAAAAILSNMPFTNYSWLAVAAIAVPMFMVLYFNKHIVRFGTSAYVAVLFLMLGAATVFGL